MSDTTYTVPDFMRDARRILASGDDLEEQKVALGQHMVELAKRDDLTRFAVPNGPSDVSTGSFVLWREPPFTALVLGEFAPGYLSPVHEHGDFWVVACGYRGEDRWDMYERTDAGDQPGHAEVKLVDQWTVTPGTFVSMPPPPRAIHSHNNASSSEPLLELIFSAAEPLSGANRTLYDVGGCRCWGSAFNVNSIMGGDRYPEVALQ